MPDAAAGAPAVCSPWHRNPADRRDDPRRTSDETGIGSRAGASVSRDCRPARRLRRRTRGAAAPAPEPAPGACPMTSAQHEGSTIHNPVVIGEHRHAYHLRHDELGPGGHFPPSVLTGVLQEAAADGSAARGFPLAYYARERSFWVIRRITFRHDRPLRYGDSLEVTTWVSRV